MQMREKFKTMHNVFDEFTNRNIYKLITEGHFKELIGDDDAAPKLIKKFPKNPKDFFDDIIANMEKLLKANLVHADLSAFNILNYQEKPVFIDFSQATPMENSNALEYLRRDVRNVCSFFTKHKVAVDEEKVYNALAKKV